MWSCILMVVAESPPPLRLWTDHETFHSNVAFKVAGDIPTNYFSSSSRMFLFSLSHGTSLQRAQQCAQQRAQQLRPIVTFLIHALCLSRVTEPPASSLLPRLPAGVDVWRTDGGHPLLTGGTHLQEVCPLQSSRGGQPGPGEFFIIYWWNNLHS